MVEFIEYAPRRVTKTGTRRMVRVRCECGKVLDVLDMNFKRRPDMTCGCRKPVGYHGFRSTDIYRRWDSMIQRCYNAKSAAYPNYGGRGIFVCSEWREFLNFKAWADISGFKKQLELDRIDNSKGYSPDNCRWVTHSQNNRNKRDNYLITFNQETKTVAEWSEITGIHAKTIQGRINLLGWTTQEALTKPVRKTGRS